MKILKDGVGDRFQGLLINGQALLPLSHWDPCGKGTEVVRDIIHIYRSYWQKHLSLTIASPGHWQSRDTYVGGLESQSWPSGFQSQQCSQSRQRENCG